ncbi:eukaryotic mitochondrial regulator protein-domain-containing protein [Staphylotrichum tortipilum]|uniref:Eukaryotic mitochondrial regulator protein-domain-containing protein n=1 Tax=Staphylotrichum tortipilum TaxID=2831512 RepID=A0AAN6RQ09_9PEZI|nr:eukaryotic mitochondrial regulator protein-domain-containing protein [Staphylotrichum longicolle]
MPPRIPGGGCRPQQLLTSLEAPTPSCTLPAPALALRPRQPPTASSSRPLSTTPRCSSKTESTKPPPQLTRVRRKFLDFLEHSSMLRKSKVLKEPTYLSNNVVTRSEGEVVQRDMPFPNNPYFRSQSVLSAVSRERVWSEVMEGGMPIKAVAAKYSVDVRRVTAVVRMMEIEKRWEREGKPLAYAYARSMGHLVPQHNVRAESKFEPINDLHVHSHTMQQLFVPTSESRHFTRADAARAFGEHILPPEARMRIPELVDMERKIAQGVPPPVAGAEFIAAARESEQEIAARNFERARSKEARTVRVQTDRFEFRFEKIDSEAVGPKGRSRTAVGWRYGVPLMDRRRAEVKIPTSMD